MNQATYRTVLPCIFENSTSLLQCHSALGPVNTTFDLKFIPYGLVYNGQVSHMGLRDFEVTVTNKSICPGRLGGEKVCWYFFFSAKPTKHTAEGTLWVYVGMKGFSQMFKVISFSFHDN
ncbi:hypothetical protein QOT17_014098 [Balamuthia mandrillaris]